VPWVDDKPEFGGLRDRQVDGLHALEDLRLSSVSQCRGDLAGRRAILATLGRPDPGLCPSQHGAIPVTLSGKGARRGTRGRKASSTKTKGPTRRADRLQESRAELYQQLEACRRALAEAREHQTATSDVLDVISTSPGELAPVFDAILSNATRICGAHFGTLFLTDGDALRVVAMHNMPPAIAERRRRDPLVRPGQGSSLARMAQSKQLVQIPDITADPGYLERDPDRIALVELGGYRSILTVPMLKDNQLIGAFNIFRREYGPFTDRQIELVTNFASRRSSPSRMPACSESCENRCSNRRLPPTCSRSSAARLSICRRCFRRWSNLLPTFAMRTRPR
jgi:hypothetical protein